MSKQTIKIHNKEYETIASRVQRFLGDKEGWSIHTVLVSADVDQVVMKAEILDDKSTVRATGYAEEIRGSTNINKTSALENAETSAVGRALAFVGYAGTEIASADEVANAVNQQAELEFNRKLTANTQAIMDNIQTILTIRTALIEDDLSTASEAWFELSDDEKKSIWVATSKGGVFTTKERDIIKSDAFRQAHYG